MTDLDARVAALMSKIVNYRYVPIELVDAKREEIEQAIRAELQKPAQEEITDAESKKWLLRSAKAEALLRRVHRLMPIFEKGMGQLAFTAETGGKVYAEMRAIQLELSGHTEESWTEAVIRASKGEKT